MHERQNENTPTPNPSRQEVQTIPSPHPEGKVRSARTAQQLHQVSPAHQHRNPSTLPTIHKVIRAAAQIAVLEIASPGCVSARERGGDATLIAGARGGAVLQVCGGRARHVAAVVVGAAGQREGAGAGADGAAVVVGTRVGRWAGCVDGGGGRVAAGDDCDAYDVCAGGVG